MKILNPFRFYRGMGGSNPDWPALVPPDNQNLLKSISISESVDLLCEGPIYGLVDQFGKKVYGLDMLKGIYLNKVPVMHSDGKYNFRNVVMEINLGTENQKPLQNFKNIYIWKPANFRLLGPILGAAAAAKDSLVARKDPNTGLMRNFESWAAGWPTDAKDPFVFVHHIKNKDVKKIKIGLIIEALFDTIDIGADKGKAGKMGMSRATDLTISVSCGTEGSNIIYTKQYTVNGTVQSPYACMLGEAVSQFDSGSTGSAASGGGGALIYKGSSAAIGTIGTRVVQYPLTSKEP